MEPTLPESNQVFTPQPPALPPKNARPKVIIFGVLLLVGVAVGVGLFWLSAHKSAPKNSNSISSDAISTRDQLAIVCHGGIVSGAPKYRSGQPPYATTFLWQSPYTQDRRYLGSAPAALLIDKTVGAALRRAVPGQSQLVACLDRVSETDTGKTCEYTQITLPIYDATYRLTVYEAATHRTVASASISSIPLQVSPGGSRGPTVNNCSLETLYDEHNPRVYYPPNDDAIIKILSPLVR
jgi:hypothetical protein